MRIKGESIISSITIVKTIYLLSHPFYLVNKQYFQGSHIRQNSRLFLEKLAIWKWKVFCEIAWFCSRYPWIWKNVSTNDFLLWYSKTLNYYPVVCFPLNFDLNIFTATINRHHDSYAHIWLVSLSIFIVSPFWEVLEMFSNKSNNATLKLAGSKWKTEITWLIFIVFV